MSSDAIQVLRSQRSDQLETVPPQRLELIQQVLWAALAILPGGRHGRLIPPLKRGVVGGENGPDPAGESKLLRLDDVPDAFIYAPLALGGTP
jgi:hypothetical protein